MAEIRKKELIFLLSAGRTGTKFFGDKLSETIDDCFSVHEPDLLSGNMLDLKNKLSIFGIQHMVFRRLSNKSGVRITNEKYLGRKIDFNAATKMVLNARKRYYKTIPERIIVESYYAWYGLIEVLKNAFDNIKFICIIRDPRDWVRSNVNWGTHHGLRDWPNRFGFGRISPFMVNDSEYISVWKNFSKFEKLCWEWNFVYKTINESCCLENFKIFRYEDIFYGKNRKATLLKMLEFIDCKALKHETINDEYFSEKIHENISYKFPKWQQWNYHNCVRLDYICGDLMRKYNYGFENDWISNIGR